MTARWLAPAILVAILAGLLLRFAGAEQAANWLWSLATLVALVPLSWSVVRSLLRRDLGVDAIALVAMAGALAVGEYLAGAVVALMLAGGNALEDYAAGRARRELRGLLERAPRVAHRRRGGVIEELPVDAVAVGDALVVRAGDLIPVDGTVTSGEAVVDESSLTGEPLPVVYPVGGDVRSGTSNVGEVFEMRATRPAAESAYAAIVRLVGQAEQRQAPFVRMADRYAAILLPVTLIVAGIAWLLSADPVRAVAVLVVATPCPLILAAPIAFISGISRAARLGIIVKGANVIERLGGARTVLLDKTGTLTVGQPAVNRVQAFDVIDDQELLRLAASLDQLSSHVMAAALVQQAGRQGLNLGRPLNVEEVAGHGVEGDLDGHRIAVGSAGWLLGRGYANGVAGSGLLADSDHDGTALVMVGRDRHIVGAIEMADQLRPDAAAMVQALRDAGIVQVALVTGDRAAVAQRIGTAVGVDQVYAELRPEDKVDVVRRLQARADLRPVVMIGDGINDAPALMLADVGIAMAAGGASISSEAADAVIVVDRVGRVADAVRIGRRSLAIARQSVLVGMGLSFTAMAIAAAGYLPPVYGALLQELIDVAVILNALRALR
jgi:heavy metal translocating P-type ATPase